MPKMKKLFRTLSKFSVDDSFNVMILVPGASSHDPFEERRVIIPGAPVNPG